MASTCPRCHDDVDEDIVCCADLRHTWKCRRCGKRSTGFVVPYGRCHLCGGENEVLAPYAAGDPEAARLVEEAMQFEVDMYQFYRLAGSRTDDAAAREVLDQLGLKEKDHLLEIERKYHVHLDPEVIEPSSGADRLLAGWIFAGIPYDDARGRLRSLYDRALTMERRTRDHFARRAGELPAGPQREICRELAAEEEEHIAILESERQHLDDPRAGAVSASCLREALRGLEATSAVAVLSGVRRAGSLLARLEEADLRRAVEAICGLFYVDLFDRPDLEEPVQAAEAALVAAGERVIPIVIRLMEGSDIKSHLHLANVLGRIGAPAVEHLRRVLFSAEDPYSRSFALFALGKVKSEAAHEALPEVVGSLLHPDKEVRDSAARALGKIAEVVPPSLLSERRRREVFEALARAAADVQPAVRAKAVRSLGKLARRGYLDATMQDRLRGLLESLVTRGETPDWDRAYIVRREAAEALAALAGAAPRV